MNPNSKHNPNTVWAWLNDKQKKRLAHKHRNGNCICYGPRGALIPGSRETGKNCLIAKLSGPYADQASKI